MGVNRMMGDGRPRGRRMGCIRTRNDVLHCYRLAREHKNIVFEVTATLGYLLPSPRSCRDLGICVGG
jgi:hypothetical protein